MAVVYLISSKMGSMTYVGSTADLAHRKSQHKRATNNCASKQLIKEYGWDNLIFTVLEECTMEQRKECEQYWIDFVPHTVNLLNATTTPEAHRERAKAYNKAYRESHKEKEKASHKAYHELHREAEKTRKKAYREAHREEIKAYKKAYREARKNTPDTIQV